MSMTITCLHCGGSGKEPGTNDPCFECKGTGFSIPADLYQEILLRILVIEAQLVAIKEKTDKIKD